MARQPIVPTNLADPGGIDPLERRAIADFKRRIRIAEQAYLDVLSQIDFESFETNRQCYTYELIVNEDAIPAPDSPPQFTRVPTRSVKRYSFRTLPQTIGQFLEDAGRIVDRILAGTDAATNWFTLNYVLPAAEKGAAQAWRNLGAQATQYLADKPTLLALITSDAYQKRLGLLKAREFELMKGLSGTVKQQLSETLTAGLAQGIGPREIAKNISAQTGVEYRRAERIARTEVGQALRTARLDEATDASVRLGLKLKVMHLSALSPTTRLSHAERHGILYTVEEERDWQASGSNSINCKCSATEVLLNDEGKPFSEKAIERTKAAKARYLERQAAV